MRPAPHDEWAARAFECEARRAEFCAALRVKVGDVAVDHHSQNLALRRIRHQATADRAPVFEDSVTLGDFADFFQEMADVNDAHTAGAELRDDLEEFARIRLSEAARGLVHDEDARVGEQRAGDFDYLLLGNREVRNRTFEVEVLMREAGQRATSSLAGGAAVNPAAAIGQRAEADVFPNVKMRREAQFLVNHRHAVAACVERIGRRVGAAFELHRSGIGLDDAA